MFQKLTMTALAVGALALGAPVAQADPVLEAGCNFRAVQQDSGTGQNFEGAAAGYVAHPGDSSARVRCYISVNGTEVSATAWSTPNSTGFSVTAGRLTYAAGETDVVTFHAEHCTSHGCVTIDYETERIQVPPQEVIDLINGIVIQFVDPTICPILAGLAGTYGPIVINEQGDIYVAGEPQWDCPPYDIWPPA